MKTQPLARQPVALFRADASQAGGVGHVMRCIALAQAWTDAGGIARFLTSHQSPFLAELFQSESWTVDVSHSENQASDIERTAHLACEIGATWIVLDGYEFGLNFERKLKKLCRKTLLMVIDDSLRESAADVFVLPSSNTAEGHRSPSSHYKVGLRFALLRREFKETIQPAREEQNSILVVMGGTDARGLLPQVCKHLAESAQHHELTIRVVTSEEVPSPLKKVSPTPSLIGELRAAALVVCTASTLALEAAACGVPQILLVAAENQKSVARTLCEAGSARCTAQVDSLSDEIASALVPDNRDGMARASKTLLDGYGSTRVAQAMLGWQISLRPVTFEDAELIRDWANEPGTRSASFSEIQITPEAHNQWLNTRLHDVHTRMWVALNAVGLPLGIVRLEGSPTPLLSLSIQATHQGLGLGGRVLEAVCSKYFEEESHLFMDAQVKIGNTASQIIFKKANFEVVAETTDKILFRMDRKRFLLLHD